MDFQSRRRARVPGLQLPVTGPLQQTREAAWPSTPVWWGSWIQTRLISNSVRQVKKWWHWHTFHNTQKPSSVGPASLLILHFQTWKPPCKSISQITRFPPMTSPTDSSITRQDGCQGRECSSNQLLSAEDNPSQGAANRRLPIFPPETRSRQPCFLSFNSPLPPPSLRRVCSEPPPLLGGFQLVVLIKSSVNYRGRVSGR